MSFANFSNFAKINGHRFCSTFSVDFQLFHCELRKLMDAKILFKRKLMDAKNNGFTVHEKIILTSLQDTSVLFNMYRPTLILNKENCGIPIPNRSKVPNKVKFVKSLNL